MDYVWALLIGYLFGCFLTADVVCRAAVHKSAFDVGVGNPGMANVGHELGTKYALVVLAGDILKTLIAVLLAWSLFGHNPAVTLWAGVGATAGHNHPLWHRFKGGKGVTTTCSAIILADPLLGCMSSVLGLAIGVAGLGYLCLGALLIPSLFLIFELLAGAPAEALIPSAILCIFMFWAHMPAALGIRDASTPHAAIADRTRELLHLKKR